MPIFATQRSGAVASSGVYSSKKVLPSYDGFGTVSDVSTNETVLNFTKELQKEFSLDWTEENFHPSVKKMLSASSRELASLMPIKNIVYSSLTTTSSSVSFSFYAISQKDEGYKGSAVIENGKIIALTLEKTTK